MRRITAGLAVLAFVSACTQDTFDRRLPNDPKPFPSTYQADSHSPYLISNVHLLDGAGNEMQNVSVLVRDNKIEAVGENLPAEGIETIDGTGKWLTPGLIDNHSHLGVYPSPSVSSTSDGNELTTPDTANVWAEHAVWPQDPGFNLARAGGVTAMQILPGSGNLIGGRGVSLKNVPAMTASQMKFPGAPHALKMACGENPKRVYGNRSQLPSTRMGNMAGYRTSWIEATEYKEKWDAYLAGKTDEKPSRDLRLETLSEVLRGNIRIHNHCYRADEMLQMIELSREFGYEIASFHHAVEAYKIGPELAQENICSSLWSDWWGFKLEAYDGIKENIAIVENAGACAIVHSDSGVGIQHLNQDAAKAMASGRKAGIDISPAVAIQWITLNPAISMGIDHHTGTVEAGKAADLVLWSGNPFSVYSKAEQVFIDGIKVYDRFDKAYQAKSDYELGLGAGE
jgi:imidazolonepropionase-like amidohydrolase